METGASPGTEYQWAFSFSNWQNTSLPHPLSAPPPQKVETLVDTVVATPAAVGDGLGKAKEAVSSAGDVLESIPRTVEEIPLQVCACERIIIVVACLSRGLCWQYNMYLVFVFVFVVIGVDFGGGCGGGGFYKWAAGSQSGGEHASSALQAART